MTAHPSADEATALVLRGWDHLRLQRPLAAWAAWQHALRLQPRHPAATEALDRLAHSPTLPHVARMTHRFRPPAAADRQRWNQRLAGRDLAALDDAATAFHDLVNDQPDDAPALANLALCQAWQGRNHDAVATLDRLLLATAADDPETAAHAALLAELLRHGAGAEPLADDFNYVQAMPWPAPLGDPAAQVPDGCLRRLPLAVDPLSGHAAPTPEQPFEWLDRPMPAAATLHGPADCPRVLASAALREAQLVAVTPDPDLLDRFAAALAGALAASAHPEAAHAPVSRSRSVLPLNLLDAAAFGFRLPADLDPARRRELTHQSVADFYENRWIHRPRHGLAGPGEPPLSPLEAAALARDHGPRWLARLEGVIQLREQLARRPGFDDLYASYSFDRLRRRLDIPRHDPNTAPDDDHACHSRRELQALDPSALSADERAAARASALGLDDPTLANRFPA